VRAPAPTASSNWRSVRLSVLEVAQDVRLGDGAVAGEEARPDRAQLGLTEPGGHGTLVQGVAPREHVAVDARRAEGRNGRGAVGDVQHRHPGYSCYLRPLWRRSPHAFWRRRGGLGVGPGVRVVASRTPSISAVGWWPRVRSASSCS
jgi:hypothetical protein